MKVRFKNIESKFAFTTGGRANMSIAEYMGNEFHKAQTDFDGSIKLVDNKGNGIVLDAYGKAVPENGWNACFFKDETQYLEMSYED
ncbi:hypothetical protein F485_gp267 [Aeromonas phage CC2]|uniref:Uncharacterized protein n=1 Tax=Aeromonas phage CC2 TaxID=1204516 RepID=I6WBN7_9CAUD|nr:hypothetical protein F485_gp267 [Aeromonas phage CC2]AFN39320.1 hypothetical protein CC2_028 [Aeromonas phage CC2]